MSTRAIREALDHMEACDTGAEMPLVRAARAEVEAIEKAATALAAGVPDLASMMTAQQLLEDIARQAPKT